MKKKFSIGLAKSGGRNFLGRITVYHRGGGRKFSFLFIDRFRRLNQYGYIIKLFRVRNFSSLAGFVLYDNGLSSIIVLSSGLYIGSKIYSGVNKEIKAENGWSNSLSTFGVFSSVHCIETFPFSGFKIARSAGCSATIVQIKKNFIFLKLKSGWQIKVSKDCVGVLGICSRPWYKFEVLGKAGVSRSLGIRPTVRGVVKNPCDHPHGGGEGKGSPPAGQVSPWGRLTKGTPTKNKKADRLRRRFFKELL